MFPGIMRALSRYFFLCMLCAPLNGVLAGAQTIDVVLHLGQSNQVGTRQDGSMLTNSANDGNILYWEYSGAWNFKSDSPALIVGNTNGWSTLENWGGFGPSIGLLRYLYEKGGYFSNGRKLAGFKFAWNGTPMVYRWRTGSEPRGESLFEQLELRWRKAKAELEAAGFSVRIVAVDWTGNEGDSNYFGIYGNLTEESFKTEIGNFIAELRGLSGASSDTVMLWNRVHDGDPAVFDPGDAAILYGWPIVRKAQVEALNKAENAVIVNTDGFPRPASDIHYLSSGKEMIGVEKAIGFLALQANPSISILESGDAHLILHEGLLEKSYDLESWGRVNDRTSGIYVLNDNSVDRIFFRTTNKHGL